MFDQVFKIQDSGVEQGVFAAVDVKKTQMICADSFVWVLDDLAGLDEEFESRLSARQQLAYAKDLKTKQTKMYEQQYVKLCKDFSTRTPRIEDEMRHLHPKQMPGEPTGEWLYNVLKINGWLRKIQVQHEEDDHTVDDSQIKIMLCIYKGSKFNHSCRPSLMPRMIIPTNRTLRDTPHTNATGKESYDFLLYAMMDVPAGEQATVSYIRDLEIEHNVVERRKYLQEKWGFECDCVKCREDLQSMEVERENRVIVDTLADKKIIEFITEQKRALLEQRNTSQHNRAKRAKNRHITSVTQTPDVSNDSQNIGKLIGKFLDTKSTSPLPPPTSNAQKTPSQIPSSPSKPISPRPPPDISKSLSPTPPQPSHTQTPTLIPVLPLSHGQEESLSPPSLSSLWQNTEIPSSSIEMSSPLGMDEHSPEHMSESPHSRQKIQESPHSTEHMHESPPAHVIAAEQASVAQPIKLPTHELVPDLHTQHPVEQFAQEGRESNDASVASGNTPTKIGANCLDELRIFLNWCRVELISFWQNADVFTILSCLIAMRVRYQYVENLDTTQQIKKAISFEIQGCFTSFYQKICLLSTSDKSYHDIPHAGLNIYAYDSLFCSQTLAACVNEIADISKIAYSPQNRRTPRTHREHWCHVTRGWFYCLQRHSTGIDKQLKAIRENKPRPMERIQLPAHIRYSLIPCLVPSQAVWIRILMAACTHVIKQLDEKTEF